jgi:DNA anti-recombination protein RmuC
VPFSSDSRFVEAHLKIGRANHHIRDIEKRIGRLEESYTAAIEVWSGAVSQAINTIDNLKPLQGSALQDGPPPAPKPGAPGAAQAARIALQTGAQ